MTENERQQRMVERIVEDERLRGELEDDAATALVNWASERAASAAADPTRSDEAVEADVQALRKAARSAALSGESDPQRLIALAESNMAAATPPAPPAPPRPAVAPAVGSAAVAGAAAGAAGVQASATAPQPPTPPKQAGAAPASTAASPPRKRKRGRLAEFFRRVLGKR